MSLLLLRRILIKKKRHLQLVIASVCKLSCKESQSNGGSKPSAGESKEERRVWGLTLNPDPEAEKRPKDALKTTERDVPPSRARISF